MGFFDKLQDVVKVMKLLDDVADSYVEIKN